MKSNLSFARPLAAVLGATALMAAIPAFAADVISQEPPAPVAPMEIPPVNTWSGPYAGVSLGYGFSGDTRDKTYSNSVGTDGFVAGAFAGYNYQTGNVVAGVEGSLRARLGYTITPEILLYATAGAAAEKLEVKDFAGKDSNTMIGWTAGAGADMMVTQNVFGRVEYRYTDFGSDKFNTGSGERKVEDSDHRVTFGLGVKF
jgi:outer membrane immunogenic protein